MPKHYVFLFRHCVRSSKIFEKLHNNWTAVQSGSEPEVEIIDFVEEGLPDFQTPDYACTKLGLKAMEGTGRHLFHELVGDLLGEKGGPQKKQSGEGARPLVIQFQLLADYSQRDVDSALSLQQGLLGQMHNQTANADGAFVVLKGLDRIDFYPDLFRPSTTCPDKLSSELFQDLVRREIEHRQETVVAPSPGLRRTMTLIERRGGRGRRGSLKDVPTWIPGPKDAESKVNTSSPLPVVIMANQIYLAGPINLISWIAELAYYSRAGGQQTPFLMNLTIQELYRLVEYNHWSRTVLSVENSIAARRGVIFGKAILGALRQGFIPIPERRVSRPYCAAESSPETVDAKVTLIVGHDGDIDSVATTFGLRWRLPPPYHTSPGNHMGEYIPTPPGSAMQFVMDTEDTWVNLSYRFPILVKPFDKTTLGKRIPRRMQRNSSGRLEKVPMYVKTRWNISLATGIQPTVDPSGYVTRATMMEHGWDALQAQMDDTLKAFPESRQCYENFWLPSHIYARSELPTELLVGSYSGLDAAAFIMGFLLLSLVGILYLLGYRLRRDGRQSKRERGYGQVSPAISFD